MNLPPIPQEDRIPAIILAVLIVILGIQPNWMLRWSETEASIMSVSQSILLEIVNKNASDRLSPIINYSESEAS